MSVDPQERELLERAGHARAQVEIVVSGCAYRCCGRGWRRKDGYEQTYAGFVQVGTDGVLLENPGIGSPYFVMATFEEVQDVRYAAR